MPGSAMRSALDAAFKATRVAFAVFGALFAPPAFAVVWAKLGGCHQQPEQHDERSSEWPLPFHTVSSSLKIVYRSTLTNVADHLKSCTAVTAFPSLAKP